MGVSELWSFGPQAGKVLLSFLNMVLAEVAKATAGFG